MTESVIYRDIKRQLLSEMQELLNRRINQASAVLESADLLMLMHEVATSCVLGAMTLAVSNSREDGDLAGLLDAMETSLVTRCRATRASVMRTGAAIRAGEKVTEPR